MAKSGQAHCSILEHPLKYRHKMATGLLLPQKKTKTKNQHEDHWKYTTLYYFLCSDGTYFKQTDNCNLKIIILTATPKTKKRTKKIIYHNLIMALYFPQSK